MSQTPQLKVQAGWFAAGAPLLQAMDSVSDGAFKLFVYLCLKADRSTGELTVSLTQLAQALHKSRRSLSTYLGELQSRGLCQLTLARNQHEHTRLQISEPFWPYRRSPAREPQAAESQYVDQIARLLLDAPGVQCSFSPADRQLAARFYRQGLSLPADRAGPASGLRPQAHRLAQRSQRRSDHLSELLRTSDSGSETTTGFKSLLGLSQDPTQDSESTMEATIC